MLARDPARGAALVALRAQDSSVPGQDSDAAKAVFVSTVGRRRAAPETPSRCFLRRVPGDLVQPRSMRRSPSFMIFCGPLAASAASARRLIRTRREVSSRQRRLLGYPRPAVASYVYDDLRLLPRGDALDPLAAGAAAASDFVGADAAAFVVGADKLPALDGAADLLDDVAVDGGGLAAHAGLLDWAWGE